MEKCDLCLLLEQDGYRHVWSNAHAVIVLNIEPIKAGHLMILSRSHKADLGELSIEEAADFLGACHKAMWLIEKKGGDAPMLFLQGMEFRTQKTHVHAHVLPSQQGIRRLFTLSEGTKDRVRATKQDLQKEAEEFRGYCS